MKLWVIESKYSDEDKWYIHWPINLESFLTRNEARDRIIELRDEADRWGLNVKFRITKYIPQKEVK